MGEKKPTGVRKGTMLAAYRAKRDFSKSPEPSGAATSKRAKPAEKAGRFFCVQKHLASHLHYDFRLEHDGVLLSWAVPKGPSLNPADKRLAMKVEDHPFDYGEFEGVIPEGYGAGIVLLWDKGTWEPEPGFENVGRALAKGELKFRLDGVKLKGSWVIVNTNRGNGDGRSWLLIKHRDEWAGPVDVAASFPMSVKSNGDFEDILAQDKPDLWESHRPAKGGEAGEMLQRIIEKAARLKAAPAAKPKPAPAAKPKGAPSARRRAKPAAKPPRPEKAPARAAGPKRRAR
jgi:bifunctional non-homologous end joining protein LigD